MENYGMVTISSTGSLIIFEIIALERNPFSQFHLGYNFTAGSHISTLRDAEAGISPFRALDTAISAKVKTD